MITVIKPNNVEAYQLLFEEASDILSGYERVYTYDVDKEYYYKTLDKTYEPITLEGENETEKLLDFANKLTDHKIYTPILNEDGSHKKNDQFVSQLGITTLEEYYNWLPELKADKEGNPTKYTILPLLNNADKKISGGEDPFIIDANSRAIQIPSDFKKNGIAVQGDDLAEVVYFEVDRYFDAVDLNNCEIFIQWETPKSGNTPAVKSVSEIYLRDIQSKPGKLIFGWAISDAITGTAGNLKFSVRFIQWDENAEGKKAISYSLNTLTAQVAIHPSIGIDLKADPSLIDNADNANSRLLDRIKESIVVGAFQAAKPYFIENLDDSIESYDIIPMADGTYMLTAIAKADDTGAINYVWKKRTLNPNNTINDKIGIEYFDNKFESFEVTEYVKASNGLDYPVLKAGRIYYLDAIEDQPYDGGLDLESLVERYPIIVPKFYERKATLIVKDAGVYTVEARNRIFNSMTTTESKQAWFKCPEEVQIDNSKETSYNHILGEDSAVLEPPYNKTAVGDVSFQWYKAPETNTTREIYEIGGLLEGAKVSYGADTIRIMFKEDTKWVSQNVGEGGDPNSFYFSIKTYAPKDAVYFKEGSTGLNRKDNTGESTIEDALNVLEAERELNGAGGTDPVKGAYRINWMPAAIKEDGVWTYWGKGATSERYIGWVNVIEWYNAERQLIKTDFVKIQLSNEDSFNAMNDFQEIKGATGETFRALEEGLYMAEITRTRNARSISENSIEYRVTEAPQVPVFATGIYEADVKLSAKELIEENKYFTIEMDKSVKYDSYEITWMLYRQDIAGYTGADIEIYKEIVNANSSNFNPLDAKFDEVFANSNVKDKDGSYYALVRTKRNGVFSASTERPAYGKMFVVTGYEQPTVEE